MAVGAREGQAAVTRFWRAHLRCAAAGITTCMMNAANSQGMYGDRARYYDAIYHWKSYEAEARRLREILVAEGVAEGSRIVEAACGTGSHLAHLKSSFMVSGFDVSPAMVDLAKAKLPGVGLFLADMTDFTLSAPADGLLCLFSSIGYVHPEQRLRAAAACFARAVRRGGVVIIEPWIAPENYKDNTCSMHTYDGADMKLCRTAISRREGEYSVIDFHWLAADCHTLAVDSFSERHVLWMCSHSLMMKVLDDAGFDCRFEENGLMKGRGLIIGRNRE